MSSKSESSHDSTTHLDWETVGVEGEEPGKGYRREIDTQLANMARELGQNLVHQIHEDTLVRL